MTPLTPANLAAIERRAAAATEARAALRARLDAPRSVFDVPVAEAQMRDMAERDCAADVPALLRHITALQAQHAGEVAEYADALERSRSSIAQACDEAVRAKVGDLALRFNQLAYALREDPAASGDRWSVCRVCGCEDDPHAPNCIVATTEQMLDAATTGAAR